MKAGRKATGGKYKKEKKKKLDKRKGQVRVVKLAEKKTKILRAKGGNNKLVSLSNNSVNVVTTGKSKKSQKTTIKNVIETPSNRFLARQNIIVKGAIIETEIGKARITNRPSQEGTIQAVIIKDQD